MKNPPSKRAVPAAAALTAVGALTLAGLASASAGAPTLPVGSRTAVDRTVASAAVLPDRAARAAGRPNVLLLTADDMTVSDLALMPHTRHLLIREGTTLTQGLAPTPICVPARASLLTGQYAHNHGARTIDGPHGGFKAFRDANTLPVWLKAAGYDSFFSGKYLNGYGEKGPRYVPPGWRGWRATVDPTTYAFYNSEYNINGRVTRKAAHNSDVLSGFTTELISARARTRSRPWFAWVNFVAPHFGGPHEPDDPRGMKTTTPARRHRNMFRDLNLPHPPEMFVAGGSPFAGRAGLARRRHAVREVYQQRIEALQSVDEAVAAAVRRLRRTRQLANTYVIFTSDNGYLVGHHDKIGKLIPYDRSLRVPIVVRGPGIPRHRRSATPTTNPDLAVTIAAIAGVRPGRRVDGVDMLPYWRSSTTYDRVVPIEAYPVHDGSHRYYSGIRYGAFTYARTSGGKEVLFDRAADPGELHNGAGKPAYADELARMRAWHREYRDCAGASCPGTETFTPRHSS